MKIFQLTLLAVLLASTAQASSAGSINSLDGEFSMVDANHDGSVTKAELSQMVSGSLGMQNEQVLSNLDKDGNGYITKTEYMGFYGNVNADNSAKDGLEAKFGEIDSDNDGKISASEMDAFRRANLNDDVDDLFAIIDTNGDQKISQREFDTFCNQMKELLNL